MFNQEASFTDGNLRLPENFTIEETVGGGDCFFDSVAKGLRQLKPDMQFTVESLRVVCRDLARDNQDIKKKVIDDARQDPLNNPSVEAPHPDVSNNDELWGFYLSSIEYARESRDKISTKDNIERRYGNTLHVPIWGRPEIEGQMICQKYNTRVIVLKLANGETEFLIEKNLLCSKAYVLRWHIEETTQSRSRVRKFFWGKFRDKNFGQT